MAKKSAATRSGAQRNRSRTQKNIELVRPTSEKVEQETPAESVAQTEATKAEQETPAESVAQTEATSATSATVATATRTETKEKTTKAVPATSVQKGSAAPQSPARRQASQKVQQRSNASLITSEHFAYVRRDLITITILASSMFAIIIVLYFVFGPNL